MRLALVCPTPARLSGQMKRDISIKRTSQIYNTLLRVLPRRLCSNEFLPPTFSPSLVIHVGVNWGRENCSKMGFGQ